MICDQIVLASTIFSISWVNGDCSWTNAGSDNTVTLTGLSLQEGVNYSFEVYAYTSDIMQSGVSSSKRFFVYNPTIIPVDTFQQQISPVLSTQFGAMSEEELDDLYAKSKYLATNLEQDQYEFDYPPIRSALSEYWEK